MCVIRAVSMASKGCSKYSYVHREAFAVSRARMYKKAIDSLGGPRLRDERRVGGLEAVALQGPPARESDPGFRCAVASQAEALPRDAIEATRRRRRVDGVWAARLTPSTRC